MAKRSKKTARPGVTDATKPLAIFIPDNISKVTAPKCPFSCVISAVVRRRLGGAAEVKVLRGSLRILDRKANTWVRYALPSTLQRAIKRFDASGTALEIGSGTWTGPVGEMLLQPPPPSQRLSYTRNRIAAVRSKGGYKQRKPAWRKRTGRNSGITADFSRVRYAAEAEQLLQAAL